jgi:thiol-disulfide isomerase/thioredoxin
MPFLAAAVVLVGALGLFNLLLTFAVLRRLREHTEELARLRDVRHFDPAAYDSGVLVGRTLPEFATSTGNRPELVGFFDATCSTCHEHAPEFAVVARRPGGVAVVTGAGPGADDLIGLLADVPTVLTGDEAAEVADSLGVQAFPTFLRVDQEGTIVRAQLTTTEGLIAMAPA